MSKKSGRQEAREAVVSYHEASLTELVAHVPTEIDRYRDGELGAFDIDQVLFQYPRAKEPWKFCNMADVEVIASHVREAPPISWWERGAPVRR